MMSNSLVNVLFIYRVLILLPVLYLAGIFSVGCSSPEPSPTERTLSLSSTVFYENGIIPDKYTCHGENVSPPISWEEPPAETESLTLIVDDLDTSGDKFTHWVIFNIPTGIHELPEGMSSKSGLLDGPLEGKNDFGKTGYGGPCPPSGKAHRYRFTVYALDIVLDLKHGVSKAQVMKAMEDHTLAQGELIGIYQW